MPKRRRWSTACDAARTDLAKKGMGGICRPSFLALPGGRQGPPVPPGTYPQYPTYPQADSICATRGRGATFLLWPGSGRPETEESFKGHCRNRRGQSERMKPNKNRQGENRKKREAKATSWSRSHFPDRPAGPKRSGRGTAKGKPSRRKRRGRRPELGTDGAAMLVPDTREGNDLGSTRSWPGPDPPREVFPALTGREIGP